jgi:hypothetical protein
LTAYFTIGARQALSPGFFEGQKKLKNVEIMGKKLLLLMFGAIVLFISIYGCRSMAVQMSDGKKLYRAKCSSCHNIIEPNCHNRQTWYKYVDEYGKKMTIEEKRLVLQYLVGSD